MSLHHVTRRPPEVPLGMLPPRMRVLYITTRQRTGGWLAEAFATDSASDVSLEEALGSAAGLNRLRDEAFDAVLLSHEPGELDALEFVEGLRGGGSDDPLIVLGSESEQELSALCYEVGADAYVCAHASTTRALIWVVARAIERHRLIRENNRLSQADARRLQQEHHEAERLLEQQRALIRDLETLRAADDSAGNAAPREVGPRRAASPDLPEQLVEHYRELLRAYVIMGSGNLAAEMSGLTELLATAGISARQAMNLHLHVLEELVRGLGSRSTRHVMARADLLALEVMVHLAEGYRQRYQYRISPPRQQALPGFDDAAPRVAA